MHSSNDAKLWKTVSSDALSQHPLTSAAVYRVFIGLPSPEDWKGAPMSGFVDCALAEIRKSIAPADDELTETRRRREAVRAAAESFRGAGSGSTFASGSLAHGTANSPLNDADSGVVLDPGVYDGIGPGADGPGEVMDELRSHIREQVIVDYPKAILEVIKRAIIVRFHEPLAEDCDPSVDMVVALPRSGGGLWIPNNDLNRWDPSDPIAHTRMIVAPNTATRSNFARSIRVAKAWNRQFTQPVLCSFNIEALALGCIANETSPAKALETLFNHSATEIARRLTPDPAGVSDPIKLPAGVDQAAAANRLTSAGLSYARARAADENGDLDTALEEMRRVFNKFEAELDRAARVCSLRVGNTVPARAAIVGLGTPRASVKPTSAWGG